MENNKKNIAQIVVATISIMVVIGVIVLMVTQVGKNSNSTDKKVDNNIASTTKKSADNEMGGEGSEDKNISDNNADKNTIGKNITDKNTTVKAENTTKVTGEADLEAVSKNTTAATKTAAEKSTEELTTKQTTQLQTTRQADANPSSKNNTNSNGNMSNNGSNSNGNSQGTGQTTTTEDSYVDEVIRIVNEERAKQGLQPLKKNNDLCKVAGIRATETTSLFSHTRPNGESCFTILKEYNISYMTVGENIAAGQQTPAEVMNAWMNSQGHRENIMNSSFGQIGVGVVKGGSYGIYWVQMFTN